LASAIACREIAYAACRQTDAVFSDLLPSQREKLGFFIEEMGRRIRKGDFAPCMVSRIEDSKPIDFCFMPVLQYGTGALTKDYASPSALLDDFYTQRDSIERMKKKSADILKTIVNVNNRTLRKLAAQREELETAVNREKIKTSADLLMANLHLLEKGQRSAQLENFYEPDCPLVCIRLDEKLSPHQNAQKYYRDYQKAKAAEQHLKTQIELGEIELKYLESLFDSLSRAQSEKELGEIRDELVQGGYLSEKGRPKKPAKREQAPSPMIFCSSDGFAILCGKNNRQNEYITLRAASKQDVWFHVKDAPGSHTVVITGGKTPPERTLYEAAVIAAYHSRARDSGSTPVDFTAIKNVKKPAGSKPGMVIYDNYQTVYVKPDRQLVEALKKE
jgi:predicted ribosome quality control (RQC) complex YloA/Tae2 family protein